ncbi:IS3 family transposase [Microbacterium resistens]|uniref:IS3 family transposase n=1 Tax=Microbacterium resistens TaxID=156977 RepID=UPI000A3E28C3|nr:IS3 family transposase [Microbacterium resistens]
MPAPRKYPPELRERAMRLVAEARREDPELSLNAAVVRIGLVQAGRDRRGRTPRDDHERCRSDQTARGGEPGTEARERDGGFNVLRAGARPATAVVVQFIDDHRDRFGVEPICRVLTEHAVPIAPSGYYAFKTRPASARAVADAELVVQIERVFWDQKLGRGISGVRKIWRLLRREGIVVARCTVERLMRQQGLRGIRRGKQFVTTRPDSSSTRPPDHVQRCFRADRPNELWVVDFTYVPTWSGMAFTAFVTDVYSRRIVGWRTMDRMPTELPLDALEMALWVRDRAGEDVTGVIQHSDAGAQYTAIRYAERLADVGAIASIGTVGDSYDCQSVSAASRKDEEVLAGAF